MLDMIPQGYPLLARRISDATKWLVVGWTPGPDGLRPIMVPLDGSTGRACVQSDERFTFEVGRS